MNDLNAKNLVLFVDDDANILKGIERSLRSLNKAWSMYFESNPCNALQLVQSLPFALVVSDMRMPEMNGIDFLQQVARLRPSAIRVILSGYHDNRLALAAIPVTHLVFDKPCDTQVMKKLLVRIQFLLQLPMSEQTRSKLTTISSLPVCPSLYQKIVRILANPNSSFKNVGEAITGDLAISTKLLQLVNSAFFGLSRNIVRPEEAVALLGLELIRNIVLGLGVFSQYDEGRVDISDLDQLTRHSLRVASLAKKIAASLSPDKNSIVEDDAFLAGLLHDLGHLSLMEKFPYSMLRESEEGLRIDMECSLQDSVIGVNHCFIGSFLIGIWGLPLSAMNAVAFHHAPIRSSDLLDSVLLSVHVADALVTQQECPKDNCKEFLDLAYLEKVGKINNLPQWKSIFRNMAI